MTEIEDIVSLSRHIEQGKIEKCAIQSLSLLTLHDDLLKTDINNCIFLGCEMRKELQIKLISNNYIFPALDVPYNVYPNKLYNAGSLYNGFHNSGKNYKDTTDQIIYRHFINTGKISEDIGETLARRLHDHSITDALYDFLNNYDEKKVVAVMGGHGLSRADDSYLDIARVSKQLTEENYLMVSGGGPGAMEATHLGAWFAGKNDGELIKAIETMKKYPRYHDDNWLISAFQAMEKYPAPAFYSLGIPTWLYGHEPTTPFATHIAKYFANSVREDGLLTIAKGGIIFSPGSAGTFQEIFQEITQNHYLTFGYASPMVFLNKKFWTIDKPVYPLIQTLINSHSLLNLNTGIYNDTGDIINHVKAFTNAN